MNKRNISKHGMNWDTGIAALKNKISHDKDKEVFNAVAHIILHTMKEGFRNSLSQTLPLLSYCWSAVSAERRGWAVIGQLC